MPVDYPVVEWREPVGDERVFIRFWDGEVTYGLSVCDALVLFSRLGRVLAANVRAPEVINPEAVGDPDQTPIVRMPP